MKRIYNKKIKIALHSIGVLALFIALFNTHSFAQEQKSPEQISITNQIKTLTIYPVPVTNVVHIRISPALREEISSLEIISLVGRKMTEQSIVDPNTLDVSFNNLNEYPGGIYMILAKDKYGKIVKSAKMIIDR